MHKTFKLIPFLLSAVLAVAVTAVHAEDIDKVIPAPLLDPVDNADTQTAVLAGGCYWGQQGLFEHVKGVTRVVAGYSGGSRYTATPEQVAREDTGHAESVEIEFDPKQISYGRLLQIYFSVAHDPTQLNAQGPDTGNSYRSEIFFASPMQERVARAYVAQLEKAHTFSAPIVTKIEPLKGFYRVMAEQQDYLVHNPDSDYIVINDLPKIMALKAIWPQYYNATPVTLPRD